MKKNQKSFTVIEISVLVFVLFIVTVVGFLMLRNSQSRTPADASRESSTSNTIKYQGTSVSLPLFSLNSPTAKIIFVVPDGWVADRKSNLGFFADDLTYKPGTKFSYSSTRSDKDIQRFMISPTDANDIPKEYKVYQKTDVGNINGNKTTLYYHEFAPGENIGNVHMKGGEKEYMYFIVKGSDAVMTSYYILSKDQDQKSLIDQVVQSISF